MVEFIHGDNLYGLIAATTYFKISLFASHIHLDLYKKYKSFGTNKLINIKFQKNK